MDANVVLFREDQRNSRIIEWGLELIQKDRVAVEVEQRGVRRIVVSSSAFCTNATPWPFRLRRELTYARPAAIIAIKIAIWRA
jgi:hypothetical protein